MSKVLLFNPRSAEGKCRVPLSILQIAASVQGRREVALVDGNREGDPWPKLAAYLASGEYGYFGCTVMPGPQLKQAIPVTRRVRQAFPAVRTIWGGYFPSNQLAATLSAPYVDFVVCGPGDAAFPALLDALASGSPLTAIPNLAWQGEDGEPVTTPTAPLLDQDALPPLPYEWLHQHYPMEGYLGRTFLGRRTQAYHSSVGCPFSCAFCGVVPIYNARWRGESAARIAANLLELKGRWGVDAVEFHDNNFFVSERRVAELSALLRGAGLIWWGEGRIDTLDRYADATLEQMRAAGCRMIFLGAESGDEAVLRQMNKGGTQSGEQIKRLCARLGRFDIIPEYSFVLGLPGPNAAAVAGQIERDIRFIEEIKAINPQTEIIVYLYSPVPTEGSELYRQIEADGFHFPRTLDDWLSPRWEQFDLRRNPLTPWLTPAMVDRVRNFETVLNAYAPSVSDFTLRPWQRRLLRLLATPRYRMRAYRYPLELKALLRWWRYRRPEQEGFRAE